MIYQECAQIFINLQISTSVLTSPAHNIISMTASRDVCSGCSVICTSPLASTWDEPGFEHDRILHDALCIIRQSRRVNGAGTGLSETTSVSRNLTWKVFIWCEVNEGDRTCLSIEHVGWIKKCDGRTP